MKKTIKSVNCQETIQSIEPLAYRTDVKNIREFKITVIPIKISTRKDKHEIPGG